MPEEKPEEKLENEAGEEQAGEAAPKAGKKKKKKFIMIGALALLAVAVFGGGFFAYQKFFAKDASAHAAKSSHISEKSVLVPMDAFILNLADPGRFLKLTLQMEVDNPEDGKIIDEKKPQLRDAVITLISSKSADDIQTAEGKMRLKDELVLRANQVAGKPVVKNIYFTEFIMQ